MCPEESSRLCSEEVVGCFSMRLPGLSPCSCVSPNLLYLGEGGGTANILTRLGGLYVVCCYRVIYSGDACLGSGPSVASVVDFVVASHVAIHLFVFRVGRLGGGSAN